MLGHIIMLIGPSCSGKDTMFKRLKHDIPALKPIIEYTTRLKRFGEVDGVDHNFISENQMNELHIIDKRKYNMIDSFGVARDVYYANALESFDSNDIGNRTNGTYIVSSTLEGLEAFKKIPDFKDNIIPIFLKCDIDTRARRYIKRLANSDTATLADVNELVRRIQDDEKQFSPDKLEGKGLYTVDSSRFIGQVATDIKHIIFDNITKKETLIMINSILESQQIKEDLVGLL